jgi:hypothetical protein
MTHMAAKSLASIAAIEAHRASPLEKSRRGAFSDSDFVAAGKRRDFCRLPHASFTANVNGPWSAKVFLIINRFPSYLVFLHSKVPLIGKYSRST